MDVTNHVVARCFKEGEDKAFLRIWNEYHGVSMWYHSDLNGFNYITDAKLYLALELEYQESIEDKVVPIY